MPEKTHQAEEASPKLKEAREHAKAARESMRKGLADFIPKGFMEHRRAARKEMLLAVRSLLDAAIARAENRED